tara:strand:+ start:5408 stop:8191 length:2784 start_codon:yes stop_codon:yes gene_type:complete
MNNIELYIQNTDGDYVSIDIFDDEKIQIEDSIQDVKDISKIFNTFSRDFKVPASFENNKLFKHYYNLNIDNGFDGRLKTKSLIKVGGVDYKEGYLRLLDVGLRNNKPSYYKVTFQGLVTSLKDILQNDEISDLDFTDLRFPDTKTNRNAAIRVGLYKDGVAQTDKDGYDLYPEVIFAPIFSKGKVVATPYHPNLNFANGALPNNNSYSFSLTKFTGSNLFFRSGGVSSPISNTIDMRYEEFTIDGKPDLRPWRHVPITIDDYNPSVKVGMLIKMLGDKYGLNFSSDFYHMEELDQMYMFFNGEREKTEVKNSSSAFNSNSGNASSVSQGAGNVVEYTTEASLQPGTFQFQDHASYNRYTTTGLSVDNDFFDVQYTRLNGYLNWVSTETNVPPMNIKIQKFYRDASGNKVVLRERRFDQSHVGTYDGDNAYQISTGTAAMDGDWGNEIYYYNNVEVGKDIEFSVTINSYDDIDSLKLLFQYKKATHTPQAMPVPTTTYISVPGGNLYNYPIVDFVDVPNNAFINIGIYSPRMKLIDLLLGVFKVLNLTSYIDSEGVIQVLPLRDYYAGGQDIDITQYVDIDSHRVSNGFIYKNVDMKHQEPEDVLTKNFNSNTASVQYGDIKISRESFLEDLETTDASEVVDGKDYTIESPFARMMFENIALPVDDTQTWTGGIHSTSVGGLITDMVIGNCIDDQLDALKTKPIIFYGKRVDTTSTFTATSTNPTSIGDIGGRLESGVTNRGNTAGIHGSDAGGRKFVVVQEGATSLNDNVHVSDSPLTESSVQIGVQNTSVWWNPSGIMASRYRRDGSIPMNPYSKFNSISFDGGQAYDEYEYHNGLPSDVWIAGLYQNNYEDYLRSLYEKTSRISHFKVQLPPSFINSYSLNDTLIVGTNKYSINKIKIDLLTGEGSLELINEIDVPATVITAEVG